jgi:hypothetical protein
MKYIAALALMFSAGPALADDIPYSYEDLGKIITALCQKASYGFRAEIEGSCPLILKRLSPQIDAEKAAKKEDKQ